MLAWLLSKFSGQITENGRAENLGSLTRIIMLSSLLLNMPLLGDELLKQIRPDFDPQELSFLHQDNPHQVQDLLTMEADSMYLDRWSEFNWSHFKRDIYLYNTAGQLTQSTRHFKVGGSWYNYERSLLNYDLQGNLVEWIYEEGDVSAWLNLWREQFDYDGSGNLIEKTSSQANGDAWQLVERISYIYDDDHTLREEISQDRVGGSWYNAERKTYGYNSVGVIDSCWEQLWEWDAEIWLDDVLNSYTYNEAGNQVRWWVKFWDGTQWRNDYRMSYTYNLAGQQTEEILENYIGSNWYNIERFYSIYDESGQLSSTSQQEWDYDEDIWYDIAREQFSYDVMGNQLESFTQNWDIDSNDWVNGFRHQWYYPTPSNLIDLQPRQLVLRQNYPNPFNPTTTISYSLPEAAQVELSIYDLKGRSVKTWRSDHPSAASYETQWKGLDNQGNRVSNGVYFCRLQLGTFSQTIKMLYLP